MTASRLLRDFALDIGAEPVVEGAWLRDLVTQIDPLIDEAERVLDGDTEAAARWQYGIVQDPRNPSRIRDRRLDVDLLLPLGTIEGLENRQIELAAERSALQRQRDAAGLKADAGRALSARLDRLNSQIRQVQAELASLRKQENDHHKESSQDERPELREVVG